MTKHKHVTSLFTIMIDSEIGTKEWFQCGTIFRSEGKFVSKILNTLWLKQWI